MTTLPPRSLVLAVFALGCSGSGGSTENPDRLWLANATLETEVRLVEHEPRPF